MTLARTPLVVSLVAAALLLVVSGCNPKPKSGTYCPLQRGQGDCILIDMEGAKVTFQHPGKPVEVTGGYNLGIIDAYPKAGPYAGKQMRLSFDLDKLSQFELFDENDRSAAGLPKKVRYELKR